MSDSRIAQARALIDDARTALADVLDDFGPDTEWQVAHWIKEAQVHLNRAIDYLGKIQ